MIRLWNWIKEHFLGLTLVVVLVIMVIALFISFCYGREDTPPDHIVKSITLHYSDGTVYEFPTTELLIETEVHEAEPPTEVVTEVPTATPEITAVSTDTPSPTPTATPFVTPEPTPTPDPWFWVLATAYTDSINLEQGRVPTGCKNDIPLREEWSVAGILEDLPYGTLIEIEGIGVRCVEDTASKSTIQFRQAQMQPGADFAHCETWIDVFMTDPAEVDAFGVRAVKVRVIGG